MNIRKTVFSAAIITCTSISVFAQQDSTSRPKAAPSAPVKSTAPANSTTPGVSNKIAINDPGMPAEKPATGTSTKRSATSKPTDKKKKNSAVTPK